MHGRDVRVDPVATRLVADVDSFCVGGETALDEPHIVEQPIDKLFILSPSRRERVR
jgi:hypothetical protein